jgi:hypothetical protein
MKFRQLKTANKVIIPVLHAKIELFIVKLRRTIKSAFQNILWVSPDLGQ